MPTYLRSVKKNPPLSTQPDDSEDVVSEVMEKVESQPDWIAISKRILNQNKSPTMILDSHGRIVFTNQALDRLIGWQPDHVLNTDWGQWFEPGDGEPSLFDCIGDAFRGILDTYTCFLRFDSGLRRDFVLSFSSAGMDPLRSLIVTVSPRFSPELSALNHLSFLPYSVVRIDLSPEQFGTIRSNRCNDSAKPRWDTGQQFCYKVFAGIDEPCSFCPFKTFDSSRASGIFIHPPNSSGDTYKLIATNRLDSRNARLIAVGLTEEIVTDLLRAKVKSLARNRNLTDREVEVLDLILLGRSIREIAIVLSISPRTARFHQTNVLQKLEADTKMDIFRLIL